jgi:hypothetical protein
LWLLMPTFYKLRYPVQGVWGISRGILKPSTDFIQFLFREITTFWFGYFVPNNDRVFLHLFKVAWIDLKFGTVISWNLGWIISYYFLYKVNIRCSSVAFRHDWVFDYLCIYPLRVSIWGWRFLREAVHFTLASFIVVVK